MPIDLKFNCLMESSTRLLVTPDEGEFRRFGVGSATSIFISDGAK